MGLEVKWYDDDHTILLATIAKDTTWQDYHDAINQIILDASQVDHQVYAIFYDDVGMPAGNPMPHIKQGIGRLVKQPNIESSIIAGSRGSSGFVRAVMDIFARTFVNNLPNNARGFSGFAKTLDEAVARINEERKTAAHTSVR